MDQGMAAANSMGCCGIPRLGANNWGQFRLSPIFPEAKSLGPDGSPCKADTRGLLKRVHVIAGEIRYVGKETDRKWEEGDDISVVEFAATEYGRSARVTASDDIKAKIVEIGINKCARESGFHRANFIRKLIRGLPVKRNSYTEFLRYLGSRPHE
ncbi:MAG TPA: hypothetical protein VF133_08190 [Terriglobales bacterium]